MKAYVIRIDDARRHSREERDRGKETDRPRRSLFRKTSPVPVVPVKYSAPFRRVERSPRGTPSGTAEGLTCYTCGVKGHTSRACPQKPSRDGKINAFQTTCESEGEEGHILHESSASGGDSESENERPLPKSR